MTSREYILQEIKKNKPAATPLPTVPVFERTDIDLVAHFKEVLAFVGGRPIELEPGKDLKQEIVAIYPDMKNIACTVTDLPLGTVDLTKIEDPHELKHIDLAILKGEFGVAENAAVWMPATSLTHRALPFITQHMVFIVEKKNLIWNMHQAYNRLGNTDMGGYGVFISGPSKTADIEQSLVIGAHGSRSLVVFLV